MVDAYICFMGATAPTKRPSFGCMVRVTEGTLHNSLVKWLRIIGRLPVAQVLNIELVKLAACSRTRLVGKSTFTIADDDRLENRRFSTERVLRRGDAHQKLIRQSVVYGGFVW